MRQIKVRSDSKRLQIMKSTLDHISSSSDGNFSKLAPLLKPLVEPVYERFAKLKDEEFRLTSQHNSLQKQLKILFPKLQKNIRRYWNTLADLIENEEGYHPYIFNDYGLPQSGRRPKNAARHKWMGHGYRLLKGAEIALSSHQLEITQPVSAGDIERLLETCREKQHQYRLIQQEETMLSVDIIEVRAEADIIVRQIRDFVDSLNNQLPRPTRRHKLRQLGFVFEGDSRKKTETQPASE